MSLDAGRVGVRADQVDVHGRVTSPSFLNELLEDLPEWTDMPVWVNGTEEVLPSNTSVPVTSPILADIAYPDIRRDNQYFTYRESPTPVDGLAKIKSIKGNTLVWNQLVQNGNFADVSAWNRTTNVSYTVSGNVATVTTSTDGNNHISQLYNGTVGHKYFFTVDYKTSYVGNIANLYYGLDNQRIAVDSTGTNNWVTFANIVTAQQDPSTNLFQIRLQCRVASAPSQFRNCMLIDITQLGLDITSPSDFTSLFPLPYYAYNQGTLLSFMGNGIKTVGKNFVTNWYSSGTSTVNISWVLNDDGTITATGLANGTTRTPTYTNAISLKKGNYILSGSIGGSENTYGLRLQIRSGNSWTGLAICYDGDVPFTLEEDSNVRLIGRFDASQTSEYNVTLYPMIRYADAPSGFKPYTESTLSLPISTYFPTGMKSAGTVYDELTPTKAITRIGAVNLGSLDWVHRTEVGDHIFSCNVTNSVLYKRQLSVNFEVARYTNGGTVIGVTDMLEKDDKTLCVYFTTNTGERYIYIKDNSFNDATALKNSLSGAYLFYELETPVELPTLSLGE